MLRKLASLVRVRLTRAAFLADSLMIARKYRSFLAKSS
jgi:hypothetical protein